MGAASVLARRGAARREGWRCVTADVAHAAARCHDNAATTYILHCQLAAAIQAAHRRSIQYRLTFSLTSSRPSSAHQYFITNQIILILYYLLCGSLICGSLFSNVHGHYDSLTYTNVKALTSRGTLKKHLQSTSIFQKSKKLKFYFRVQRLSRLLYFGFEVNYLVCRDNWGHEFTSLKSN